MFSFICTFVHILFCCCFNHYSSMDYLSIFTDTINLTFMEIDILGKVNEKKLAYSHTLLPVFEAIINSIHAIEDRKLNSPGIIKVQLIRSEQAEIEDSLPPITDFCIYDSGVGFNEDNFRSFNFAHSTYKRGRGGKGIGRITWLRAFQKVEITSTYKSENEFYKRVFTFAPTQKGIEKHQNTKLENASEYTTLVHLKSLKEEYQRWCNKKAEHIALRIIEHCFSYFLDENCPRIIIQDSDVEIIVNDYFRLYTKNEVTVRSFSLNSREFTLNIVKLYSPKADNKIHYCANFREVFTEKINNFIPELDSFITDENGDRYSVAVYVSGDFLDERVNEERTDIIFDASALPFPGSVGLHELNENVIENIQELFSDVINKLSNTRIEKVRTFVQKHPRYRHLLKYRKRELANIPSTLSDEKLEIELFKIQQSLEVEILEQAQHAIDEIKNTDADSEPDTSLNGLSQKVIEVGNSKLAEYVIHRKLVLELLESKLKRDTHGNYETEEAIHKLIFPLKKVSDDITFEDHNLWIIDERLAFHKYLSSDIPFNKIEEIESESKLRTDLLIMNQSFAVIDSAQPYSSIVLFEFKRPSRNDYNERENPISQVNKYCRELLSPNSKDKDGRPLNIKDGTPIYAYIVCDITPKLKQFADDAGFTVLPDQNGYFNYNSNYKLYTEIISFDKLISDSKKRNQILFEKLSLPTT